MNKKVVYIIEIQQIKQLLIRACQLNTQEELNIEKVQDQPRFCCFCLTGLDINANAWH